MDLQQAFADESERAMQIALERPKHWEYLLFAELLKQRLAQVKKRFIEVQYELLYIAPSPVVLSEFYGSISSTSQSLSEILRQIDSAIKQQLTIAVGPKGQPGDPYKIKEVADNLAHAFDAIVDLQIEWASNRVPQLELAITAAGLVKSLISHSFFDWTSEFEILVSKLERPQEIKGTISLKLISNTVITDQIVDNAKAVTAAATAATTSLKSGNTVSPSQTSSSTLQKGMQFEEVCLQLIRAMGFESQTTKVTGDGGIDIVAVSRQPIIAGKYIIQCKAWKHSVGEPLVRDLFGVVHSERANKGILITTSNFTSSALAFAEGKPLELIDGVQLRKLLQQYFPGLV